MKKHLWNNSLSIIFILLFVFAFVGQIFFGLNDYNKQLKDKGVPEVNLSSYFKSGHFLEATFENWESEFLQMALFVWLSIFLKQKGSSESKKFDGEDETDKEPNANKANAPWPVRKGGLILILYKNSLTITLFLLFIISFVLHLYGSLKDENTFNFIEGKKLVHWTEYISSSRFWFESFQNWQSEFLSVFAIIVLSIYLRQKGSSQSKPVDAPHFQTGD